MANSASRPLWQDRRKTGGAAPGKENPWSRNGKTAICAANAIFMAAAIATGAGYVYESTETQLAGLVTISWAR